MRPHLPDITTRMERLKLQLAIGDTTLLELVTGSLHVLWALHILIVYMLDATGMADFTRLPGGRTGMSGPMYSFMPVGAWVILRLVVGLAVCWYALTNMYTLRWICSIADAVIWALIGGFFMVSAPAIPAGTMLIMLSAISFHVTYRLSKRFFNRRKRGTA